MVSSMKFIILTLVYVVGFLFPFFHQDLSKVSFFSITYLVLTPLVVVYIRNHKFLNASLTGQRWVLPIGFIMQFFVFCFFKLLFYFDRELLLHIEVYFDFFYWWSFAFLIYYSSLQLYHPKEKLVAIVANLSVAGFMVILALEFLFANLG